LKARLTGGLFSIRRHEWARQKYRRRPTKANAASYLNQMLREAAPEDLPVQQPTKFGHQKLSYCEPAR